MPCCIPLISYSQFLCVGVGMFSNWCGIFCFSTCTWGGVWIYLLGLSPATSSVITQSDASAVPRSVQILVSLWLAAPGTLDPWLIRIFSPSYLIPLDLVFDLLLHLSFHVSVLCGIILTPCKSRTTYTARYPTPLLFPICGSSLHNHPMVRRILMILPQ